MAGLEILADGEQRGRRRLFTAQSYVPVVLTNGTGLDLAEGEVVAVSFTTPGTVEVVDRWRSTREFVVATGKIVAGASGVFVAEGFCPVKTTLGGQLIAGTFLEKGDDFWDTLRTVVPNDQPSQYVEGALPGRWALGFATESPFYVGATLVNCYWFGRPTGVDDPLYELVIRDDFLAMDPAAAPGAGALIRSSAYPYWATGANPNADAGPNGFWTVAGDGAAGGAMFLAKDALGTAYTPISGVSASLVMRLRWAQKTATAATRFIGAMSAFAGADPANGVYCRHTAGGNIIAVCRSGGVESVFDTLTPAAVGSYVLVELRWRIGRSVYVYVANAYFGRIDTNIPAVALGFGAHVSAAGAGVGLIIDRLEAVTGRV